MENSSKAQTTITVVALSAAALALLAYLNKGSKRYGIAELWDRTPPGYEDAPAVERQRVQDATPAMEQAAQQIADAPAPLNDNEGAALAALFTIQSRYQLMWLNRLFGTATRYELGFGLDTTPQLGEYLDAFLDRDHWSAILEWYRTLPKYYATRAQ